jgi:hypothetical protein
VIPATQQLIDYYRPPYRPHTWQIRDAYIGAVQKYGTRDDLDALLPVFLEAPEERGDLAVVFNVLGDVETARLLYEHCFQDDRLREGMSEEILYTLGYLGYEPAKKMLFEYAHSDDYYAGREAALGLLHLPCDDLRDEIELEIRKCYGRNLFPEFLPALASKTGNLNLLNDLYQLGSTTASTDCNGGLILGIALYGEAGRETFWKLLWHEHWEAAVRATGSGRYSFWGTRYLRIPLAAIYAYVREQVSPDLHQQTHNFSILTNAIEADIRDLAPDAPRFLPREQTSLPELYRLLFAWTTPDQDDSLTGFARTIFDRDDPIHHRLWELENELVLRMSHAVEIEQITAARL